MPTQIQKFGLVNGVKPTGKTYNLSDLIQESYKVFYDAKKINHNTLIKFTESHLANIKKDPTNKTLSEDLDVLQGLVKLGKDQTLKDIEEVNTKKKSRKRTINSSMKPATPIKESSWSNTNKSINESIRSFGESVRSKVFYKELDKFNKSIAKNNHPITLSEAINLYKASNSCLTHLTVHLERKPSFKDAYRECTNILARDNLKLLESIQEGKIPSRSLLENFVKFTNILLECDTPEKLDPEIYEDADIEELDDRDVINEDADLETVDDSDVLDEDADLEELDDKDVINEDADIEELDDRDVINEDCNEFEEPQEDAIVEETSTDDTTSIDLTSEEIEILKSVLGKISGLQENDDIDLVPDESNAPEINEAEDVEDQEEIIDEPIDDEDTEEDCSEDECGAREEDCTEVDDNEDDDNEEVDLQEEADPDVDDIDTEVPNDDNDELDDIDTELSESAVNRIKKCF